MSKTTFAVLLCWRCDNETISRFNDVAGGWMCENCGEITVYEFEDEVMCYVEFRDGKWVEVKTTEQGDTE